MNPPVSRSRSRNEAVSPIVWGQTHSDFAPANETRRLFFKNPAKTKVSLLRVTVPGQHDGGMDEINYLSILPFGPPALPSAEKSDADARSRQPVSRFVSFVAWLVTPSRAKHLLPGEVNDRERVLAGSLICLITAISFTPRRWQCSVLCRRESICAGNVRQFMTRDSLAAAPPTPSEARSSSTK